MAVLPSLPLTAVTADSLKQEMITRLSAYFPDWSDKADSNSMIAVLETISGLAELMYGYINRQARECFIQYAIDPRNVDAHARGMGYVPQYATPSVVDAILSTANVVNGDTPIRAGSSFATLLPSITYELVADATIKSGTNTIGPVQLKQQQSWVQEFTSAGLAITMVTLNQENVMPDTIQVFIDGVAWSYVEHFVDSDPTSNVFTTRVSTSDYSVVVIFGDGVCGAIPPQGSAGQVKYKTGGGKAGAIPSHYLRQCLTEVRDGGSNQVLTVNADNDYAAAPGGDPETTDQIKKHAANFVKAPRVLFDLTDIENAVEAVPGVLAVKAVNWEILPELPHYLVELFVLPETSTTGSIEPSPALIEAIMTLLTKTKPLVMGNKPLVAGAVFKDLVFNLQLFVKDGYSPTAVKQAITTMLNNLFDPTQKNIWGFVPGFGMPIYSSQLIAILQSVDGVRNLAMLAPGDTQLQVNEFPRIQSVTFV